MVQPHAAIFEAFKAAGPTKADSLTRMATLAHLLDSAIPVPGTRRTVGLDAVIGLIPVVGDAVSALLASYIIWEAKQLGVPNWKIARMVGNLAVDTTVGAVPILGDLFDLTFKANKRNMKIVMDHMHKTGARVPRVSPTVIDGEAVRLD